MNKKIIFRLLSIIFLFLLPITGLPLEQDSAKPFPVEIFIPINDPLQSVFRLEGQDLRIRAPSTGMVDWFQPNSPFHWLLETRERMNGDFTVGFDFEVIRFGPAQGPLPGEGNVELALLGESQATLYGINVHAGPSFPSGFRVIRYDPLPAETRATHAQFLNFPRQHPRGRLEIQRKGDQVLFLVRDGTSNQLKELVRFPYPSSQRPRIRISTYQGGKNKTYVDMKLSHLALTNGPQMPQSPSEPPVRTQPSESHPFAWVIDHSHQPAAALNYWKPASDAGQAFRIEGDLLRVNPPVGSVYTPAAQAFWHRETDWSLRGDFEIDLAYQLTRLKPAGPEGFGVVTLGFSLESYGPLGSVTFGRAESASQGSLFTIVRHAPTATGGAWDTLRFPAKSDQGRLVLRRVGGELLFLVSEASDPGVDQGSQGTLRELFRTPALETFPLKLRLSADQGANTTSHMDALITGVRLKAESLVGQDGKAIAPPRVGSIPTLADFEEFPTGKTTLRWYLATSFLVVILLIVFSVFFLNKSKKLFS